MPTYKNTTQKTMQLILNHNNDYTNIKPFQEVESEVIYDIEGLELIDNAPYFNSVLVVDDVEVPDISEPYEINIHEDARVIEVINTTSSMIYLYFQSTDNTPPTIISGGMTKSFENFHRFSNKLVFVATATTAANEVIVSQFIG